MKKILTPLILLTIASCDSSEGKLNACIYSDHEETIYCIENTSSDKDKFQDACKKLLTFQQLKDKDATMTPLQSCPRPQKASCLNAFTDLADQYFYENPSQDIERLDKACQRSKGTFILNE
ncbi:MAG: hypothetical protein JKY01_14050 [Pseudomonadales bacterium]|nr:hypothetical protein [Pseudomonadales bacterium]